MTLNDFERQTVPPHLHALAARARATLGRFTTYPGTALRLQFGGGTSAFVAASIETEDAAGTGRQVCVQKAARFDLAELEGDIAERLGELARAALVQLFTHEVDEWLRLDDAPLKQPHQEPTHRLKLHLPEGGGDRHAGSAAPATRAGEDASATPAANSNEAANAMLRAALKGASMEELRQLSKLQLRSFFSLLGRRMKEPSALTPEEVQGLLELVTDHLYHPAL